MDRVRIQLVSNTAEDMKLAMGDIWDLWPRLDLLPRYSSMWKKRPGREEWHAAVGNEDEYVVVGYDEGSFSIWFERV